MWGQPILHPHTIIIQWRLLLRQFGHDNILVSTELGIWQLRWTGILLEVVERLYFVKKYDIKDEGIVIIADEWDVGLLPEAVEDILWGVIEGEAKEQHVRNNKR